jgi:hypothetical protein
MYQIALPFSDFCLHSGAWTEPFHSESLPSRFSADGLALAVSHFLGIHRHAGPSTCVTRAAVTITWGRGPRWKWNQRTNGKPGHGHRRNGSSAPFQRAAPCGGRVQFEYFKFRLISTVRSRSDGPCAGGAATDGAVWARRRALFLSDLTVAVAAFLSALAAASPPVPNSPPTFANSFAAASPVINHSTGSCSRAPAPDWCPRCQGARRAEASSTARRSRDLSVPLARCGVAYDSSGRLGNSLYNSVSLALCYDRALDA